MSNGTPGASNPYVEAKDKLARKNPTSWVWDEDGAEFTGYRRFPSAPDKFDVLLRHRLLREPGGFEGAVLARKGLDPHDPSVAQRE